MADNKESMVIHCVGCDKEITARLTTGKEIYPHREDLYTLSFWICDTCNNYVGCHKNGSGTNPLGNIPTKELRQKRKLIHSILDPLWKSGNYKRKELYARLTELLGWTYHTAKIKSIEEADKCIEILYKLTQI